MTSAMSPPSNRTWREGCGGDTSKHRLASSPRERIERCFSAFCRRGPGRPSGWRTLRASPSDQLMYATRYAPWRGGVDRRITSLYDPGGMVRSNELLEVDLSRWASTVDVAVVSVVVVVVVPFGCSGCRSRRRFERVSAVVKRFLNLALNTTLSPCETRWAFPLFHRVPPPPPPTLCGRVVAVAVDRRPFGRVDDGGVMPAIVG